MTVLLVSALGCSGGESKSLEDLTTIASSEIFGLKALAWVEENLPTGMLTDVTGRHYYGGGMAPGSHWVENNFSWSELGLSEHSKIYLWGSGTNEIEAILFQERSRIGIYVLPKQKLTGSKSLPEYFRVLSPRTGVFSMVH